MGEHGDFARWLRDQLRRREMSEADLARALDTTPSVVNRWIRGERIPATASCDKLADVFGISVDQVLTIAGHRPPIEALEPTSPLAELLAMLGRVRLDVDHREETLRGILQLFLAQDRERREYLAHEGNNSGVGVGHATPRT